MSLDTDTLRREIAAAFTTGLEDEQVKADMEAVGNRIGDAIDKYIKTLEVTVPSGIAVTVNDGVADITGATTEDATAEIS